MYIHQDKLILGLMFLGILIIGISILAISLDDLSDKAQIDSDLIAKKVEIQPINPSKIKNTSYHSQVLKNISQPEQSAQHENLAAKQGHTSNCRAEAVARIKIERNLHIEQMLIKDACLEVK